MASQSFQYYAFISYRREDEKWAKRIQNKLETYQLPSVIRKERIDLPKSIKPVFRDKTDLSGIVLERALNSELDRSKYLIVICSPNVNKSIWVNKEIEYFVNIGRADYIIPVIVEGDPKKDLISQCYPKVLLQLKKEGQELLAINIPEQNKSRAFIQLVATILDISFDKLLQRDQIRRKRRLLIRIFVFYLPLFFFTTILILNIFYATAFSYLRESRTQLDADNKIGAQLLLQKASNSFFLFDKSMVPSFERRSVYRSPDISYATLRQYSSVENLVYSKNGSFIATLNKYGFVRIWNTKNGELVKEVEFKPQIQVHHISKKEFTVHFDDRYTYSPIQQIDFLNDSGLLSFLHEDNSVSIYNYETDSLLRHFEVEPPYSNMKDVKVDIQSDTVSSKGFIGFQDAKFDGKGILQYLEYRCIPFGITDTISRYRHEYIEGASNGFQDGSYCVCSKEGTIRYVDKNNKLIWSGQLSFKPEEKPVIVSRSSNYIYLFTSKNQVYPIHTTANKLYPSFEIPTTYQLAFSQSKDEFLAIDSVGNLIRLNLPDGKILNSVNLGTIIDDIHYFNSGKEIYITARQSSPCIWIYDSETLLPINNIQFKHNAYYNGFANNNDNCYLATYFKDGTVKLYENKYNNLSTRYKIDPFYLNQRLLDISIEKELAICTEDMQNSDSIHYITILNIKSNDIKGVMITSSRPTKACYDTQKDKFYVINRTELEVHAHDPKYKGYMVSNSIHLPENLIYSYFTQDKKNVMLMSEYKGKKYLETGNLTDLSSGTLCTIVDLGSLKIKNQFKLDNKIECGAINNQLTRVFYVSKENRDVKLYRIPENDYVTDFTYSGVRDADLFFLLFDVDFDIREDPICLFASGPYKNTSTYIWQGTLTGLLENMYLSGWYYFNYAKYDACKKQIIAKKLNGEILVWHIFSDTEVDKLLKEQPMGRQLNEEDKNYYGVGYLNFTQKIYN